MRQLVYTMFISNNCPSFHMWWKESLVKHQKVSKYYAIDCSVNGLKDTLRKKALPNSTSMLLKSMKVATWVVCTLYQLVLKQNFQKNKVVAKIRSFWCVHFVLIILFVIILASDISALYGNVFFGKGFLFPENLFQNEGIGNVGKFHWSSHKNMSSQTEGYFENP